MENNHIMMKDSLYFFGILEKSLTILYKNPKFIILTFLTSLPLLASIFIHESIFQQTLIQTANLLTQSSLQIFFKEVYQKYLFLGLFYLGIIHLLDLYNTIIIIDCASLIYAEKSMNVKSMLCRPIKDGSFRGPFITSTYALFFSCLTLLGLTPIAMQVYGFSLFPFGLFFLPLLIKYVEWSAIWNMGIVISILEEGKHGDVALGVSAYLSRGGSSRRRGLYLMLVFFVSRCVLRFLCIFIICGMWNEGGRSVVVVVVTAIQACLVCVGNVIKWVVFMVYFYDCKERFLEKKVDVEDGKATSETVKLYGGNVVPARDG